MTDDSESDDALPTTPTREEVESTTPTREEVEERELLDKLTMLGRPMIPTGTTRSPFLLKFSQLAFEDERRLQKEEECDNHVTHVCKFCNKCFYFTWKVKKKKSSGKKANFVGSFDSTKALRHITEKCNGGGKDCPESVSYLAQKEDMKKRKHDDTKDMLQKFHIKEGGKKVKSSKLEGKQSHIDKFVNTQSYSERALAAQAHFLFYCKTAMPIGIVDDPYFRNMLKEMIPLPGEVVDKIPYLRKKHVARFATAEMNVFEECLNKELQPLVDEAKGVQFCQVFHDGVTITANKTKYQSMGMQFTGLKFRCNHIVALAFRKVNESTNATVAQLGREVVRERTKFDFDVLNALAKQDGAAKGVAKLWGLPVETCDMHDGDKIGASAVGRLVQKDGRKNVVNPFPPGLELEKKLNAQAKHFSSSGFNRNRYQEIIGSADNSQDLPTTMIKQDLCGTRMNSYHGLLRSSIRIRKSLDLYFITRAAEPRSTVEPYLTTNNWKFTIEVEAILNISKDLVVLAQNEKKLNAAYGPVVRNETYKKLTSETVLVIDSDNWVKGPRAPRKEVNVNVLSQNSRECRSRATLEHERRFFGNNTEVTMDSEGAEAKMKLSNRETAVLILDKRTCFKSQILLDKADWKAAIGILQNFYVDFFVRRKQYDREMIAKRITPQPVATEPVKEVQNTENTFSMFEPDEGNNDIVSSDHSDEEDEDNRTAQLNKDKADAILEFNKVIKNWDAWIPDWEALYPKNNFTKCKSQHTEEEVCDPDPFEDLTDIDMCILMTHVERHNSDNSNAFGYLPLMARLSACQLGALNSQSFVERMNSHAKLIVGQKRTRLDHELIEFLVVLRMNEPFMKYCRTRGKLAHRTVNLDDVPDSDNE